MAATANGKSQPLVELQVADRRPHDFYVNSSGGIDHQRAPIHGPTGPPYDATYRARQLFDVGIFRDTLAPTLAINTGLSIAAYGLGRVTNRAEAKDWLWPTVPVINAWWSAVGRRILVHGTPPSRVLSSLSWVERLLLTGVTLWGGRLFYRIISRSVARDGDDPRYVEAKKDQGFWNKALFGIFLPEALVTTLVSLPFAGPFRHTTGASISGYHPLPQMLAVGLFSTGFAIETLADVQLEQHKQSSSRSGLLREGVWSLCRHPNYLGDALVHASFGLLLYSSDMLAPLELLGPIANYLFLRYVGGDAQNEASQLERYEKENPTKFVEMQQYQKEKNSFWPALAELQNPWAWTVLGVGAAGALLERGLKVLHGGLFYSAK
ncbi:hypothetical protein MBLNU230_g4453t1 [Neophaeotheca triangularis]